MKDSLKKFYSNFLNSINGFREALKEHSFVSEIILRNFVGLIKIRIINI